MNKGRSNEDERFDRIHTSGRGDPGPKGAHGNVIDLREFFLAKARGSRTREPDEPGPGPTAA